MVLKYFQMLSFILRTFLPGFLEAWIPQVKTRGNPSWRGGMWIWQPKTESLCRKMGNPRVQMSHEVGWKETRIITEAASSQGSSTEASQEGGSLGVIRV